MNKSLYFSFLILLILMFSCKNYYNEVINWADSIREGNEIETVMNSQPSFVQISWDNPLIVGNKTYYEIVEIKGNNDILKMQNFLVFENGKFQGRESKK